MTQPTSNIIPFPISPRLPVMTSPKPSEAVAKIIAVASPDEHAVSAEDRAAHVASVVRTSIRFARRKGTRLDSLPPQLQTWLLDLCDKGDPTCRMVLDWLTGNRRFCTPLSGEDA
jgi:hypothetical protein